MDIVRPNRRTIAGVPPCLVGKNASAPGHAAIRLKSQVLCGKWANKPLIISCSLRQLPSKTLSSPSTQEKTNGRYEKFLPPAGVQMLPRTVNDSSNKIVQKIINKYKPVVETRTDVPFPSDRPSNCRQGLEIANFWWAKVCLHWQMCGS